METKLYAVFVKLENDNNDNLNLFDFNIYLFKT